MTIRPIRLFLLWALTAAVASAAPGIRLENLMKIPGSNTSFPADDTLVFHHNLKGHKTATKWHNKNTLRIHSIGDQPLVIESLDIRQARADRHTFHIESIDGDAYAPSMLPLTIAPGRHADILIRFDDDYANNPRIYSGRLTIRSNAPSGEGGALVVALNGGHMIKVEAFNELEAYQVVDLFGFETYLAGASQDSSVPTAEEIRNGMHGDLVLSKLYEQADPSKPVRAIWMAAFKGPGAPPFKLVPPDSDEAINGFEFTFHPDWHQSLYPRDVKNVSEPAGMSVEKVPGPFRISVGNYTTGTGNRKGLLIDEVLGIRMFRAVVPDPQKRPHRILEQRPTKGNVLPYSYIVVHDYVEDGCFPGGTNCDWNDDIIYITNIKPVDDPAIASALPDVTLRAGQPFTIGVADAFDGGYPGNLLTYEAASNPHLPSWLHFNPETGDFSGTAPASLAKPVELSISACDSNGIRVAADERTRFRISVR